MVTQNGNQIQAFPVLARTYIGVANSFTAKGYNILHAVEDGTVTFEMGTSGSVVLNVVAGQDLAFDDITQAITSTATVWIS